MTALDGLGGVAATAMQPRAHLMGQRTDHGYRLHIWLMIVSIDCFGRDGRTGQGLTKKGFRTRSIPFVAQQYINDLPVLINGAV